MFLFRRGLRQIAERNYAGGSILKLSGFRQSLLKVFSRKILRDACWQRSAQAARRVPADPTLDRAAIHSR